LRSGRLRRRSRKRGETARRANVLGDIEPISVRPPEAADRAIPGHWEGDLIVGFNRSAIVTIVERRSRFLLLGELPDGHDAQSVYDCLLGLVGDLPDIARRSLTWDQIREMAEWRLEINADIEVYFCDPALAVAVALERAHERPSTPVLPEGHGPQQRQPGAAGSRRRRDERSTPEGPQLANASRGLP